MELLGSFFTVARKMTSDAFTENVAIEHQDFMCSFVQDERFRRIECCLERARMPKICHG